MILIATSVVYSGAVPTNIIDDSGSMFSKDTATAIRTIAQGPVPEPSSDALQAHITELEQDLRNVEFRLQFLYHQRTSTSDLLNTARRQADRVKK